MKNLTTIFVKELSKYANSSELIKFIATLKNYNIVTLQDLQNISVDEFRKYRGVGDTKIEKLQSLKTLLNDNLERIQCEDECISDDNISFSKDAIEDLKKVPIDYFISTIAEEKDRRLLQSVAKYAKVDNVGKLCELRESTLRDTPSLGGKKVSRMLNIQNQLKDEEYMNTLVRGYENSLIVPNLPSVCTGSLAQDILQFIREYKDLHQHQNVQDITAQCVELILLHGYTVKSTAKYCKKDQERVRQSVFYDTHPSFFAKLRQMVSGDRSEYDRPKFTLSDEFNAKLNELRSNVRSGMLKSVFAEKIGLANINDVTHKNGILTFLKELLDFKEFSGGIHNTRVTNNYLIYGNINDVKTVWGLVFKTLDSYVKPFIKEDLIDLIQKKRNISAEAIDTVVGIIESDEDLFIVTKDGLATKYQLRWDALQSMQSRIERILYENEKPLQKQDIQNEYDRRLQVYGMTNPDVFNIRKSKNIFQLHEGGTWIWTEYANVNKTTSLQSYIRQYVAQKQKFLIEEIMEHICKDIQNVNERSVKTLLTKYCISTSEGYYVYKNSKEDYRDLHKITSEDILPDLVKIMNKHKEYTYDELYGLYGDKYKISVPKSKIRTTCDNNPTVFVVIRGNARRNPNMVKINPEWDGVYETKDRKRGIQAEWKKNVREEIINKLRYAPNYEMKRSELCSQIKSFIPDNVAETGMYKIFKDKIFNIKDAGADAIICLNIKVWEAESKQSIETDKASRYEATEQSLKDIQQKESTKPLYYNMSRTNEDIDHLFSLTKSFISHNLNQLDRDRMGIADVEAAWSYMIKQMKIKERGEENAYYRMLNQLYSYLFLHTAPRDRYYLWVEIRFHFEPYLKSLLTLKGYSIYKEDGKEKQLKDLITLCQTQHILPNRDENNISRYIGNMLKNRNWKGHNAEDTPNDVVIIQNIQQSITLYLYTSMQFMQMQ